MATNSRLPLASVERSSLLAPLAANEAALAESFPFMTSFVASPDEKFNFEPVY